MNTETPDSALPATDEAAQSAADQTDDAAVANQTDDALVANQADGALVATLADGALLATQTDDALVANQDGLSDAADPAPVAIPEPHDEVARKPLTIAQFTDNYGPAHSGLLYAVQFLESEILRSGHKVLLVAPEGKGPNPLAGDPNRREIRLPSTPLPGTAIRVWNSRDFSFRFAQLVADPPDVIHVHGMGPTGLLGMWVAQRTDRPMVVTWHTDFEAYAEHYWHVAPLLNAIYKLYQAKAEPRLIDKLRTFRWRRPRRGGAQLELLALCASMLTEADVVTAPSQKTARRVLEIAPTARVRVIPNGVAELPARKPLAKAAGPRLLYVGRISAEKDIELLLEAFQVVRDRLPRAELLLVGEWRETPPLLRRRLQRSRKSGVTLAGQVAHDELQSYYGSADLFVFPSMTDTQALVLHEAAHAGLPFAVVDPELDLVIDPGVNALIGRPNPVSFAHAIVSMLDKLDDPAFAAAAAARSRELAAGWSVEEQADEVLDIYTDLAAGRQVAVSDDLAPRLGRRPFAGRIAAPPA